MDQQMVHYKERLKYWQEKIKNYQENCPHINHTKITKSDTGNWCPQDDSYWYDITCEDCGKFWMEDQREYLQRMRN